MQDDPKKDQDETNTEGSTDVLIHPSHQTKAPPFYRVRMLNDDFTPRDFVVHVLQRFFQKGEPEATQLMLQIHNSGSGVAGIYTFEIAETKAYQCNDYAKQNRYPLKCTVEKV